MAGEEIVEQTDEQLIEETKVKENEEKEEVGDDSTDLEKEETGEEKKEESVEETEVSLRPSYKEITKKYPEFFKDFPDLRHSIFAEQKYREIYPTVEEAQETRDNYEAIADIHEKFLSGTVEGISGALKEISSSDESALKDIASNFLVALYKTSKEQYESATAPIFESLLRSVYKDGISSKNQNLENAALLISEYLFGDEDIATGKKTVRKSETPQNSKEKETLEKERKDFNNQRYMTLSRDVSDSIRSSFPKEISKGVSVDSNELRDILTEKIYLEVDKLLSQDKTHLSTMNRLWRKASEDGFSMAWKDKIIAAYLARARTIMPSIRTKVVGKLSKSSNNQIELTKEVSTSGKSGGSRAVRLDSSKIDYRKTSDADIFDDKVVLKK